MLGIFAINYYFIDMPGTRHLSLLFSSQFKLFPLKTGFQVPITRNSGVFIGDNLPLIVK